MAARSVPPVLADIPVTPPTVKPSLYLHEGPQFLDEPRSLDSQGTLTSIQAVLSRSEARFQAGKEHYEAGEFEQAREDFDLAVETLLTAPENIQDRQRIDKKLAEIIDAIHRFDLAGLGAGELPAEPVFDRAPIEEIPEPTFPIDPAFANQVTEEIRATASQLPLELTDEVLQYIKYFSSERGHKIVASGLRRAGRYHALIQRIFDEEGIPQELIHLAQAESGFMPRAVSRMRATGMWQFMLDTGRKYGLQQSRVTDDRLDPEKATRAAARHLRDLYQQFGDWYLAMAAYNCGPLTVERAVERSGYADFWELRRLHMLPRESSNYVPIIVAMAIMSKNPAHYGLDSVQPDTAVEYSTIETEAPTHLALIADILRCPVSELLELNPALLRNVAPEGYSLRVPKDKAASVSSALEVVPREQRAAWRLHRVEEGETLAGIAKEYGTSAKGITEVNHLDDNPPEAGNLLLIPAAQQQAKSVRKSSTRTVARKRSSKRKASTRMASTASAKAKRVTRIASRSPRRRGTTVNR